jgi:hypothetical protein
MNIRDPDSNHHRNMKFEMDALDGWTAADRWCMVSAAVYLESHR